MNRRDFIKGIGKVGIGALALKLLPREAAAIEAPLPVVSVPFVQTIGYPVIATTITTASTGGQFYIQNDAQATEFVRALAKSLDERYIKANPINT